MATATQTKLDLVIGAVDKFTAPLAAFNNKIAASTAGLRRLQTATSNLNRESGLGRLTSGVSTVGTAFGKMGTEGQKLAGGVFSAFSRASLLLGGVSGGLLGLAKQTGATGEEMGLLASRAGVAVEAFQKLAYGASFSNINSEQMTKTLAKLGKAAVDAAGGNKDLAQAFKAAGVQYKDAKGNIKSADLLMLELADAFQKVPDGAVKTSFAMKLFGEEGLALIPFLNQGSKGLQQLGVDAESLGIVFSGADSTLSADFNKSLGDMGFALKGLGYNIGIQVMPVVKNLLDLFKNWTVANRNLVAVKIKGWVEGFAQRLPGIIESVGKLWDNMGKLTDGVTWLANKMGGMENLLLAVGAVLAGPFLVALGGAIAAVASLGAAFLATPIGLVIALAGAAWLIWENWDVIAAFFADMWQKVTVIFDDAVTNIKSFASKKWESVAEGIKTPFLTIKQWFVELWADIENSFTSGIGKIAGVLPDWMQNKLGISVAPSLAQGQGDNLYGPATGAVQRGELNTASTSTSIEKTELTLSLAPGLVPSGGSASDNVQVKAQPSWMLGYQGAGNSD